MATPPDSGPQRRRRSARREQGPPQPVENIQQTQQPSRPTSSGDTPAEPRVRLDRLERKRQRKPRRRATEAAAAQAAAAAATAQAAEAHVVKAPETAAVEPIAPRDGRRSRQRVRGQHGDPPVETRQEPAREPRSPAAKSEHHVEPPYGRPPERPRDDVPRTARDRRNELAERALRGLVTTRGTQVNWTAAMRAREVARPTAEDLAEAEADLVIVRRNYTPPEPLATSRKSSPDQRQERPARRGQRQSGKGF